MARPGELAWAKGCGPRTFRIKSRAVPGQQGGGPGQPHPRRVGHTEAERLGGDGGTPWEDEPHRNFIHTGTCHWNIPPEHQLTGRGHLVPVGMSVPCGQRFFFSVHHGVLDLEEQLVHLVHGNRY